MTRLVAFRRGQLEAVAVGDGVGGAGLHAVAAEDAAVVVDVVDLGVALGGGDALLGGVFGGLDVDAVGGAGRGAEKAGHALFQAVLVALRGRARRGSAARRRAPRRGPVPSG